MKHCVYTPLAHWLRIGLLGCTAICLIGSVFLSSSSDALAQDDLPADTGETTQAPPSLNIFEGPTSASFEALNPLAIFESPYADELSSPAGIINRALLFIFPLAGLILFVMLIWGGFEMITGATNSKAKTQSSQKIFAAIIGFMLLFASFWIIQIVEYVFNLAIL